MRAALALAFSVLTVTAAGCGSDVRQLKAEVTNATPATGRPAGKCAREEALIESAWTKCILVVHGTRRVVIRDVARRLRKEGFRMGCEDSLGALELVAVRGQVRVIADVRPGAVTFDPSDGNKPLDVVEAKFAPPGSRKIPAGSVGLKVSADKLETSAGSYPLPRGSCP